MRMDRSWTGVEMPRLCLSGCDIPGKKRFETMALAIHLEEIT
jgi:hypothetical protein